MKLSDRDEVIALLEAAKTWEGLRSGTPQFVINGTYFTDDLDEDEEARLDKLKHEYLDRKVRAIYERLAKLGVIVNG